METAELQRCCRCCYKTSGLKSLLTFTSRGGDGPCAFVSLRLCDFASGSLLVVCASFALSVLEEGGKYPEAVQRRLASKDAPDCHETAATPHYRLRSSSRTSSGTADRSGV